MPTFLQSKRQVPWYRVLFIAGIAVAGLSGKALAEELPPAPAAIQKMIETGQVKLEFYDSNANPRRFLGETKYDYYFRHSFEATYEPVRAGGRTTSVDVRLRSVKVSASLTHKMHLPENLRGPGLWNDVLTRHEFDHVSLSIDPRLEELLKAVFQKVDRIRFPLPKGQELTQDWINKEIDMLLNARGQAVYAIVSFNNKQLDLITEHGKKPIPNRESYFERLYTKPNLDEAGFTLTGDVLELLKSESFQMLEPRYLP